MPGKIPFIVGAIAAVPGAKVNITRIIEAVIIAGLCAMATTYVLTRTLETKLDGFEKLRQEDIYRANAERQELRKDMAEVKDMLLDHLLERSNGAKKKQVP